MFDSLLGVKNMYSIMKKINKKYVILYNDSIAIRVAMSRQKIISLDKEWLARRGISHPPITASFQHFYLSQ